MSRTAEDTERLAFLRLHHDFVQNEPDRAARNCRAVRAFGQAGLYCGNTTGDVADNAQHGHSSERIAAALNDGSLRLIAPKQLIA